MLHIYLSDRAIRDLKLYANVAPKCLNALKEAISRFNSINELLKETRIPRSCDIKRLKCTPTAWRIHFGDERIVFTSSQVWGADSIQVVRIAPRSNVYKRLARYLKAAQYIQELWNDPNSDEDEMLDRQLSSEQALDKYKEDENYIEKCRLQVHQLKGSAGTGKTTAALDLAIEAVNKLAYPILVVPNDRLQKFAEEYITKNHQDLRICKNLSQTGQPQATDLAIFTKDYILQHLAGGQEAWDSTVGNLKIHNYLQAKGVGIPDDLKNINLYNLFLGDIAGGYTQSSKDPLLYEYQSALNFINNQFVKRFINESLENRDAISQANHAKENREKFVEVITQLTGYVDQTDDSEDFINRVPILIIDEVQDFYWGQLQALIEFYISRFPIDDRTSLAPTVRFPNDLHDELRVCWTSVSKDAGRLIILAGDNNQRVTFSGFSWESFAQTFTHQFPNCGEPVAPNAFYRNFRNTAQITKAANYILSAQNTQPKAFTICAGGAWIDTPPNPEYSETGSTIPRLIKAEREWIDQLVTQLKDASVEKLMGEDERFIFIYDEVSYKYDEIQKENSKLVFLNVAEAKGQEFESVIIISPFLHTSGQPSISQLFKWYTSLTRAKEYLALLITPEEWEWLHSTAINPNDLDQVFLKNTNLSLEQFIVELLAKGRSSLTEEQKLSFLVNRIYKKIEDLLNNNTKPESLLSEIKQNKLEAWQLLDAIADQDHRDHQITLSSSINPDLSLKGLSPEEALIIYIGILPILVEINFKHLDRIDLEVISKLEQYFNQDSDRFQWAELYVQNPLCLCLIHRANQDSWTAAAKLKPIAQSSISKFLFNQIAEDLVRRGLSWHNQKFRHQFLGEEPDNNLPYPELVKNSEGKYIPRLLLEIVDSNVFSFNSYKIKIGEK